MDQHLGSLFIYLFLVITNESMNKDADMSWWQWLYPLQVHTKNKDSGLIWYNYIFKCLGLRGNRIHYVFEQCESFFSIGQISTQRSILRIPKVKTPVHPGKSTMILLKGNISSSWSSALALMKWRWWRINWILTEVIEPRKETKALSG